MCKQNTIEERKEKKPVQLTADLIVELYSSLFYELYKPKTIHSDSKPLYYEKPISQLLKSENIILSTTEKVPHQNQIIETINNQIKTLIIKVIWEQKTRAFRRFRAALPQKFKNIKKVEAKAKSVELRKYLFNSEFFLEELDLENIFKEAITRYNEQRCQKAAFKHLKLTKSQLEFYNTYTFAFHTVRAYSKSPEGMLIEQKSAESVKTVSNSIDSIIKSNPQSIQKQKQLLDNLAIPVKPISYDDLEKSFLGIISYEFEQLAKKMTEQNLALFNQLNYLINHNEELRTNMSELHSDNQKLLQKQKTANQLLTDLKQFKDAVLEEKALKEKKRQARLKSQKQLRRDPITAEEFSIIIDYITYSEKYNLVIKARYRIMCTLLLITGCRISEVLTLRLFFVIELLKTNSITIYASKQNNKPRVCYLSEKAKKLLNARTEDIILLLEFYNINLNILEKDLNDLKHLKNVFLFQGKSTKKPLSRQTFTNQFNQMLQSIPHFKKNNYNFKSHSFRIGFVTQLWTKTGDIELVRQIIGHTKIKTTSAYIKPKTNQQIKELMQDINIYDLQS